MLESGRTRWHPFAMRLASPPGQLIDLGTHRLHLLSAGAGPPVVFDAALGASCLSWTFVQPRVARFAQALTYDRAGFGWSEAGPLPRTIGRIAGELRALLAAAGVPAPYILVGHSFGALTVRLIAQQHPDEIAGMVLLDPPDPLDWRSPSATQRARLERGVTLCRYGERAARLHVTEAVALLARAGALRWARACARWVSRGELRPSDELVLAPVGRLPPDVQAQARRAWTQPKFFEALGSQIASLSEGAAAIDDAPAFGALPVVVVSGGGSSSPAERDSRERLAARSSRGRHLVAEDSGHWIPLDRPDVVAEAVRGIVSLAD